MPKGEVPGEWYAPTQPMPTKPAPYGVQHVNADTIIDFTPELHAKGLALIQHYRTGGPVRAAQSFDAGRHLGTRCWPPAFQGGTNWPGGCYDPETRRVFVFTQNTAEVVGVVKGDLKFTENEYVRGVAGVTSRPAAPMGDTSAGPGTNNAQGINSGDGFRAGQNTVDGLPILKPPYGTHHRDQSGDRQHRLADRPWRNAGRHQEPSGAEGLERFRAPDAPVCWAQW